MALRLFLDINRTNKGTADVQIQSIGYRYSYKSMILNKSELH